MIHNRAFHFLFLILLTCAPLACSRPELSNKAPNKPNSISDVVGCSLIKEGYGSDGTVPVAAETIVSGLEAPWSIAFLPGSESSESGSAFLVTERPGRVRLVRNGALVSAPVLTVPVSDGGESGLLGIALHPEFKANRLFYIYYTTEKNGATVNRIERYRLDDSAESASPDRIILDDIPAAGVHDGGKLRFGPDGMLYAGTGDSGSSSLSQDPASLAGKVLRLTPDGGVPPDNPIPGNPAYLLGIRNTQGFDWIDGKTMIVADHGPTGHDEVSFASAGANLGWPTISSCEEQPGLVTPAIVWADSLPPGGLALYRGSAIPAWRGSALVGALRATQLQRLMIDTTGAPKVIGNEVYFRNVKGRIREVITGPDGEIYLTTSNCDGRGSCGPEMDSVLKIRPG